MRRPIHRRRSPNDCRAPSTRWSSRSARTGGDALAVPTNLATRTTSWRWSLARSSTSVGSTYSVNNAAITFVGDLQMATKRYDLIMDVNCRAPFIAIA